MAFADVKPRTLIHGWGQSQVTLGAAVVVGDLIGISANAWVLAKAAAPAVLARYIAAEDGASGDNISVFRLAVLHAEFDAIASEIGDPVYLSDTAGETGLVAGATTQELGWVDSEEYILVAPRVPIAALDGSDISNDSVDSQHLATGAVDSTAIAASAVNSSQLADDAVTSTQLADDAVDTAAIQASAVTGAEIADAVVDSEHFVASGVDSTALADDAVDTAAIQASAVTGTALADAVVDSEHFVASGVDATALADDAVDTAAIQASAVTGTALADGVVDSEHFAAGGVDATAIAASAVDTTELADGAVTPVNLDDTVHGMVCVTIMTGTSGTPAEDSVGHSFVAGNVVAVEFINESGAALSQAATVHVGAYSTPVASSGATLADGGATYVTGVNLTYDDVAAHGALDFTGGPNSGTHPQYVNIWIEHEINDL